MSAPSNTPLPPLPPDCRSGPLFRNVRCGCFGYREDLQDPKWDILRKECETSLGGNIANGRRFCNSTFLDNGSVQRNELDSFFRFTASNCATRSYDIKVIDDKPYPSSGPQVRLVQISEGLPKTNHEEYFSGYAEVPSYQTASVRMDIKDRGYRRLKNLCVTLCYNRGHSYRKVKGTCYR